MTEASPRLHWLPPNQTRDPLTHTAIVGELGLAGDVRPIRVDIGKILMGKHHGIFRYIIPASNLAHAVLGPVVQLVSGTTLEELHTSLNDPSGFSHMNTDEIIAVESDTGEPEPE